MHHTCDGLIGDRDVWSDFVLLKAKPRAKWMELISPSRVKLAGIGLTEMEIVSGFDPAEFTF